MSEKTRPRVGFYGLTGCAGCLLSVIFNEDDLLKFTELLDIVSFPFIKEENDQDGPLDIAFVEGTIVSNDDLAMIKKIRKRSKVVVALGACAHLGNIPAEKRFVTPAHVEYLQYDKRPLIDDAPQGPAPLSKVIDVDFTLPGCPPDRDEIKTFIKETLIGKTFRNYKDPVCIECKLNNNGCLIDEGEICLGPIIAGGCKAICPTNGLRCYGCRGLTDDANLEEYFNLMKTKGHDIIDVQQAMETFMSIQIHEALKGTKWELKKLH